EHRKIRVCNNGANAELDEEIGGCGNVANQQSDMPYGKSWTRIVHHGSPDEGKNLGAAHRHAGSDSDRLITMLHHRTDWLRVLSWLLASWSNELVARVVSASNFLRYVELLCVQV